MSPRRAWSSWCNAARRGLAPVAVLLSAAGLLPVASAPRAAAAGLTRVDVIGDSITSLAAPALESVLGSKYQLTVSGRPGIRIAQDFAVIRSAPRARDWVVELGTNDAGSANPEALADLATELHMLLRKHCVELVTVGPTVPGDDQLAQTLDMTMLLATQQHQRFHLLDWGDVEYLDPAWLEADQVHPTAAGSAELASLIDSALAADCGG